MLENKSQSLYTLTQNFILTVLLVLVSTALLLFFRQTISTSTVALIYLVPVLVSSILWGLGPALTAAILGFLAFNYFFIQPYYTLLVHHTQDLLALIIFLLVAVLISQLVGRVRHNMATAQEKERELSRLYELSVRLAGGNTLLEIANILIAETSETFLPERVELQIKASRGIQSLFLSSPNLGSREIEPPIAIAPLQTVRVFLGELRIWRANSPLDPTEQRMLQTFATQGALALERTALLQSETRAKILEESDRMKSALLNSVSHELRTPLATIKASITSLLGKEVDWDSEARDELLETVDEETDQLNNLVGSLLDMSRLEAGVLNPNRQWNVLTEIIDSALNRMRRPLKEYRVEVDIPDELPLVPVDYAQIERLFTNLISNSIKFSQPGTMIQIKAAVQDSEWVKVQIVNEGPPVPEEHLDRIFDKFYRVTAAEQIPGTGLGLSICKGIVEAHGGQIWAKNLPGKFVFNFLLPLTWDGKFAPEVEAEAV